MNKPPLLWDFKNKVFVKVPYEQMDYLPERHEWYVDTLQAHLDKDLLQFIHRHPRYFYPMYGGTWQVLRRKPQPWLAYKLHLRNDGHNWLYWGMVALNMFCAAANITVMILRGLQ